MKTQIGGTVHTWYKGTLFYSSLSTGQTIRISSPLLVKLYLLQNGIDKTQIEVLISLLKKGGIE